MVVKSQSVQNPYNFNASKIKNPLIRFGEIGGRTNFITS